MKNDKKLDMYDFLSIKSPKSEIRKIRLKLNLSQRKFSKIYKIPFKTLRDWDQGRCSPSDATLIFVKLIGTHPEQMAKLINSLPE